MARGMVVMVVMMVEAAVLLGLLSRAAPAFTVRRAVLFHSSWVYKVLVSPHEVEGEKKRPGNEGVGSVCSI